MGLTKITSQNLSSGIDPILLGSGTVDFSKLDYLKNVTSDIQTQINSLGGGPGGGDGNLASYTGGVGFLTYTSTGIYTTRILSTGSNKVSISNNTGNNGNPIFDINEENLSLNNLGSILSVIKGGTGSDLSTTSGFLYQSTTGANVITRILTSGDIPNQIDAIKIADGSITNTNFKQLSGVTSNIQQQLSSGIKINDSSLLQGLDQQERILRSKYTTTGTSTTTASQANFVFLGRLPVQKNIKYVEFVLNASGRGTQVAEVGLFSSTLPPCKSGLVFTRLTFNDAITNLTGGSPKVCRNITGFIQGSGYTVAAGTYLWAGARINMGTSQPSVRSYASLDMGHGFVQTQNSAPSFTGAIAGWSGSLVTSTSVSFGIDLAATMD